MLWLKPAKGSQWGLRSLITKTKTIKESAKYAEHSQPIESLWEWVVPRRSLQALHHVHQRRVP